jgi:hypothetical protein
MRQGDTMTDTKELIMKLKEVKEERGLSLNEIVGMVEKNGDYVSRSSIQRVFSEGSEMQSFRYEETIRPIAKALLDMEEIEETDSMDTQAMKALLKYKIQRIEDLEHQIEQLELSLSKEKVRYHEKLDKERERFNNSIEFLKRQVAMKDRRMDILLDSIQVKDAKINELVDRLLEKGE